MTKRQISTFAVIVVLFFLAVFGWGWAFFLNTDLRYRYESEVSDIAYLLGQYATARSKTGHWPEPAKLYGLYFHLRSSVESKGTRIDNYSVHPDGPWLQIKMLEDGQMWARVTWEERDLVERP